MQKVLMVSRLAFFTFLSVVFFYACKPEVPVSGNKFPADKVMSVFVDKSGVVWAGTDVGLLSYWNGKWSSYTNIKQLPQGEVLDLAQEISNSSSELWLATANGAGEAIYLLNAIISATSYKKDSMGLMDNQVNAVLVDTFNARWFATSKGLSIFKGSTWYSETDWDDLVANPVVSLAAKSDGWIFAGTKGKGVGRFRYDKGIDGITGASYYNTDWTSLPSDTILSIYVDQKNQQWFGTTNGVAFHSVWETKQGWKSYSVNDGLIHNRVQAIMGDGKGVLWFGTPAGVSSFDGTNWKSYGIADGLINRCVNDIAIDPNETIWFATNGGISTYDGKSWKSFSKE